jgi:hypothetical protein
MFRAFLKAVFLESWPKIVFLVFDIIGIVVFFLPNLSSWCEMQAAWARVIGAGIFFLSFLLANFLVYRELAGQLLYKADIYLEYVESNFFPSAGGGSNPFRRQGNPNGFSRLGIPDWGRLHAVISINNRGCEDGKLKWKLDETRINLPTSLFDIGSTQDDDFGGMGHSTIIEGGVFSFVRQLTVAVLFTEEDPHIFARKLKELIESEARYEIIVRYWTERPDGTQTKPRDLPIRGDFQSFYRKTLEYWDSYGHRELADLARFMDAENA